EAGFAQRLGQRAERVPVERLRRHRAAAGGEGLRGWGAAEVLPQVAQQPDELLTRREAARDEPGLALRRVPAPEVLDHRLGMHARLRVGGELTHRRRTSQPLRARAQLLKDLGVRVALTDSGLEGRERVGVDLRDRPERRLAGHAKKDRAFWKERKLRLERLGGDCGETRAVVLALEALEGQDPLQSRDAAWAELGACRPSELLQRLCGGPGGPVDARREHGVERVRDMDDASSERDVLALQPVRVTRAVEALVVVADGRHGVVQKAEAVDDACPFLRMALHERPLLGGQARRLQENRVRNRELADVVEEGGMSEQVELRV